MHRMLQKSSVEWRTFSGLFGGLVIGVTVVWAVGALTILLFGRSKRNIGAQEKWPVRGDRPFSVARKPIEMPQDRKGWY